MQISDADHDPANQFHEVAILPVTHADRCAVPISLWDQGCCLKAYMLVDKVLVRSPMERPRAMGSVDPVDQVRQAIGLFAIEPPSAKCGRNLG